MPQRRWTWSRRRQSRQLLWSRRCRRQQTSTGSTQRQRSRAKPKPFYSLPRRLGLPSPPPPFGCLRFGFGKREPNAKPTEEIRSDANGGRRRRRKQQGDTHTPFRYSLRTGAWNWEHSISKHGPCSFLLSAKARSRRLPVLLSLTTPIPPSRQQAYRRTASLSLLLYYLNNGNTHAQVWLGPALASTNHLTYLI